MYKKQKGIILQSIIILCVIILLALIFTFPTGVKKAQKLLPNKNRPLQVNTLKFATGPSWEIHLRSNIKQDSLTILSSTVTNYYNLAEHVSDKYSSDSIIVEDKHGKVLYKSKIHLNDLPIIDNFSGKSNNLTREQVAQSDSYIYIPYVENASKLVIYRGAKKAASIDAPQKSLSFKQFQDDLVSILVPQAAAQVINHPLRILFVGDNYESAEDFQLDLSLLQQVIPVVYPFNKYNDILEIIGQVSAEGIHCNGANVIDCLHNNQEKLHALRQQMSAAYIMLISKDVSMNGDVGVMESIGGKAGIVFRENDPRDFAFTIMHELLGHGVGELHDRYIF